MITLDVLSNKSSIVCSEAGDVIILEGFHYFGLQSVTSFVDDTYSSDVDVFFEKYFQYTVDGIHWSDWVVLDDLNLSSIDTKTNHTFSIRYRYIRRGDLVVPLYFHSVTLSVIYSSPIEPSFYKSFFTKNYFSFFNTRSIEWSVNVLNKTFKRGIVPSFIERERNLNWSDEDFINFWWTAIYFQSLKVVYDEVFTELFHYPDLLKKFISQKGLYVTNNLGIDEYYYIITHFYDEVMKRGSASILDKNRALPVNYEGVSIKGELLRLCNQKEAIESVFGIISEYETGWIVGRTSPIYRYPDFYRDFIRAFEVTEEVENISLYPLYNSTYVAEEEIIVDGVTINALKVNTGDSGNMAGVASNFQNSILVDSDSDYEISFKIKGLQSGNRVYFKLDAFNSLGVNLPLQNIRDLTPEEVFLDSTTLSGDLFVRGSIMFKNRTSYDSNTELPGQVALRFVEGVDRISPVILVSNNNNCYIYDIKVRVLPLSGNMSYLLTAGELIIKIVESSTEYSEDQLKKIIGEKLIPISMNVSEEQRVGVSELNEYIPYELPFVLRLE